MSGEMSMAHKRAASHVGWPEEAKRCRGNEEDLPNRGVALEWTNVKMEKLSRRKAQKGAESDRSGFGASLVLFVFHCSCSTCALTC